MELHLKSQTVLEEVSIQEESKTVKRGNSQRIAVGIGNWEA